MRAAGAGATVTPAKWLCLPRLRLERMIRRPMATVARLKALILGRARDPLRADTRHHMALVAFLAWVGLGADGLSSACYGPEEAFRALGDHTHLALYLALAMAVTVFVIALAYNQVIELFPSGGGGYKVATHLLGAHAGLVSGAALIVDYVLTIAISVASGADAALQPAAARGAGVQARHRRGRWCACSRSSTCAGSKNRSRVLAAHLSRVLREPCLPHRATASTPIARPSPGSSTPWSRRPIRSSLEHGWLFIAAILLRAYSLGGGTYTGLEAVSNNVNMLAEPRVSTGRDTMLYMALSLSFTAGGIILLYLLWEARPVPGQTLNAVVFASIIESLGDPGTLGSRGPAHRGPGLRGGSAPGRRQHRVPGRPRGARQHGGRFLGTASVPQPLGAAGDAERRPPHGAGRARDPGRGRTATSASWWCSTASTCS